MYLQQDAFDAVDGATSAARQQYVFERMARILRTGMTFDSQDSARRFFQRLTQVAKDWNRAAMESPGFSELEQRIDALVAEVADHA